MSETSKPITFERDGFRTQVMLQVFNDGKEATRWYARYEAATPADIAAALAQKPDLRAEVLRAVLPSEEEMARVALEAMSLHWPTGLLDNEERPNPYHFIVQHLRKAMGVE